MKLKLKNRKYWVFHYELFQEYKLTSRAKEVFSFLYTHCVNYHNDGWCGYSNEKMAEIVGSSSDYIWRGLKELKENGLIIVENPGKRTKRPGESRQIFINAKNFISEEIPGFEDSRTNSDLLKSIEQLKRDNEELQLKLNKANYELAKTAHITELGRSLIQTGFISEEQYKLQAEELNHILLDFESWHKEGRDLTKACFNYWNTHRDTKVRNYVKYILACIEASKGWIIKKDDPQEDYFKDLEELSERWYDEIE